MLKVQNMHADGFSDSFWLHFAHFICCGPSSMPNLNQFCVSHILFLTISIHST